MRTMKDIKERLIKESSDLSKFRALEGKRRNITIIAAFALSILFIYQLQHGTAAIALLLVAGIIWLMHHLAAEQANNAYLYTFGEKNVGGIILIKKAYAQYNPVGYRFSYRFKHDEESYQSKEFNILFKTLPQLNTASKEIDILYEKENPLNNTFFIPILAKNLSLR